MIAPRLTHWFDPRARVLYLVRGPEGQERIRDVVRARRFDGVHVHTVQCAWVALQRRSDPFAKEIDLTTPEMPRPGRVTVFSSLVAKMHG